MTERTSRRASGLTPGQETAKEITEEEAKDPVGDVDLEPGRKFRTPGFSRMRATMDADNMANMSRIIDWCNKQLTKDFPDVFKIHFMVDDLCGVKRPGPDGEMEFERNPYGMVRHDWSRLTIRQREDILYEIQTHLFGWEQREADIWFIAMAAKARWEERFSITYDEPRNKTMGEREALGNIGAADERYQAIQYSLYSRKSEALVRRMASWVSFLENRQRGS